MDIITRKDAYEANFKHYFTGKPCSQGHVDARYVSTGACKSCQSQFNNKTRTEFLRSPEVAVLRGVQVPRKHLKAILAMIDAFMKQEGLAAAPPPPPFIPTSLTVAQAAAAAARIAGLPLPDTTPDAWDNPQEN